MFHEYEIVMIIRPDLDEAETIATFEKVAASATELGAHIIDKVDWGKKKLAYLIRKFNQGKYMILTIVSGPEHILEIERRMRLDDRIIRFLTVKSDEAVDVEARVAAAEERRKNGPDIRKQIDQEPDDDHGDEDDYIPDLGDNA